MSQILNNLWLGNINNAKDVNFINKNNINVVVNCTKDIPFIPSVHFKYRIPVNDDLQEHSFHEMYIALNHIIPVLVKHINRGDKVFIHCFAGMQRSAIVTLALLTALTFNSVFNNNQLNQNSLQQYYSNLKNYLSKCRPIVFTPGMNFEKSYASWLNDFISDN